MKQEIIRTLKQIEERENITILYACESGSRAWGFPSQDSDYDVRFIYAHPTSWYLSIEDHKDTITDVGKVLDFSGWEFRKALKLFRASNSSLYEKLQSPIIYMEAKGFRDELWNLKEKYYRPQAGLHHYLSHAHNFIESEFQGDTIKLKKYFYTIRAVLSAQWIEQYNGVPPMELQYLRELIKDDALQHWIDDMLMLKVKEDESLRVDKNIRLNDYLEDLLKQGDSYAKTMAKKSKGSIDQLDELFRKWILNQ